MPPVWCDPYTGQPLQPTAPPEPEQETGLPEGRLRRLGADSTCTGWLWMAWEEADDPTRDGAYEALAARTDEQVGAWIGEVHDYAHTTDSITRTCTWLDGQPAGLRPLATAVIDIAERTRPNPRYTLLRRLKPS